MNGAISYVKSSIRELRNVSWPTNKTTLAYTAIVVAVVIVVAALLGASDYLFTILLEQTF